MFRSSHWAFGAFVLSNYDLRFFLRHALRLNLQGRGLHRARNLFWGAESQRRPPKGVVI